MGEEGDYAQICARLAGYPLIYPSGSFFEIPRDMAGFITRDRHSHVIGHACSYGISHSRSPQVVRNLTGKSSLTASPVPRFAKTVDALTKAVMEDKWAVRVVSEVFGPLSIEGCLAAAEDAAWSQFWPIFGRSHGLPL